MFEISRRIEWSPSTIYIINWQPATESGNSQLTGNISNEIGGNRQLGVAYFINGQYCPFLFGTDPRIIFEVAIVEL